MIDIHAHLLPGVDDGAKTLTESLNMIRSAKAQGFQGVVLTPHYYPDHKMTSTIVQNKEQVALLKKAMKAAGIEIDLFLGNEVFYGQETLELLGKGHYTTLNDSRYLLVETMRQCLDFYSFSVFLNKLRLQGITPIIAHPERYEFIQNDPNSLVRLIQDGNLAQLNILSLIGYYGKTAQATAEILLTHKMVHFLASDAHSARAYDSFDGALAKARRLIGQKRVVQLADDNPKRLVADEKVDIMEPCYFGETQKRKRNFWEILKKQMQLG
ncbi:MAG: protein-tyrosine phosphatase [Acetobacterium sp.]|nr:protein-tyrosine phosphatase [Acetobacterium sp.]